MSPLVRSDEGFGTDDPNGGPLITRIAGVDVRESTWAGAYYCSHVLWVSTRWARAPRSSICLDGNGDPLVGFIHVPADAESGHLVPSANAVGDRVERSKRERHASTMRVLACAIRGIADELARVGTPSPCRVLISGFGPFAAVTSNPTGDLVDDDDCMAHAIGLAFGTAPAPLGPLVDAGVPGHAAAGVVIARTRLDVDDACLAPTSPGSLPWTLERFRPHALIALGVHRASSIYRVEIEPTSAGLADADASAPIHQRGRAPDARAPTNRALAQAILRGARSLGLGE